MAKPPSKPRQKKSSRQEIGDFLKQTDQLPVQAKAVSGRLLFAIDATASRQPSWDSACQLQGQMFQAAARVGGLAIQLCYYRGFNEFHYSPWCVDSQSLLREMTHVQCLGGYTQIAKVLMHAIQAARDSKLKALVFIGDALEEQIDQLCQMAGQLGVLQCPVFLFQEGFDTHVAQGFEQIARLSGGAYHAFNEASADELAELLAAVAVFAAGGQQALAAYAHLASPVAKQLLQQLKT